MVAKSLLLTMGNIKICGFLIHLGDHWPRNSNQMFANGIAKKHILENR